MTRLPTFVSQTSENFTQVPQVHDFFRSGGAPAAQHTGAPGEVVLRVFKDFKVPHKLRFSWCIGNGWQWINSLYSFFQVQVVFFIMM